jgi:phosphoserine phosphatase
VKKIGKGLGFDYVFGTVVEVEERLKWFPRFPLGNNKGDNKVVRLREELGLAGVLSESTGYSDSKADLPMLALCEQVVAVHPEGDFAAKARAEGWRVLYPEKSWKNRIAFALACLRMSLGLWGELKTRGPIVGAVGRAEDSRSDNRGSGAS